MAFSLTSPAFRDGERIPSEYTADGANFSPPLQWSDPPQGTRSFALVVEDPDAPSGTFRHWGLYNITGERTLLPEGLGAGGKAKSEAMKSEAMKSEAMKSEAMKSETMGKGVNDFGEVHYHGPAPPRGHGTHHYHFKLAALDVETLSQAPKLTAADIWKAAEKHMLGQAELVGTYSR